ncbi:MAG TPA: pitrilysin family protein, partial [Candidatus Polarisedimenticolia bacterium]|nr:pitrilysin family protein [Candidatus Polarisedimenticolia bacterium]
MSRTIKEVLPNGLTVLVTETHASPVVAINLWVRAGYFDEDDREVGISHVIEHMFFKGTADRPRPDQIAVEIKGLGGDLNAGTYYDSTNYYVVLPAANFRKGLEIQADALIHPAIDPAELGREIEAVLQEARRKIDTPSAYAMEMMYAEAFRTHRIRRWRIGTEEGLRAMTRDDLLAYYRSHYVPGRVILSIVGAVDVTHAVETARLFLGGMEAAEGAPLGSPPEPSGRGFGYRRMRGDIARSQLVVGFHAAPALTDDDMALRILAHLLGSGRSSRLYQAVKENRGLVDSIGMGLQSFRDIGVMAVVAGCEPGKARAALGAIQAELEGLRREPPTTGEIERARTAIEFQHHQSRSE